MIGLLHHKEIVCMGLKDRGWTEYIIYTEVK